MTSSLDPIFQPRSIAVIGASRTAGTIGHQIIDNLLVHRYTGAIFPVNPKATAVHSIPAYARVTDIPGDIDLGIVVVPKELVLGVVDECGEKGIPALVVISAGFREIGGAGVDRERRLMERVRHYGMRLVGPNCMGVVNTDPAVSMNATFAPTMPPVGPVSFMSQSGAMGVTILDYAAEYQIGIRHFASVGNKPDVSGNDLIEYWSGDADTRVILMYLENFGNPRKFTRIAREVTRHTPIVVVKAGRTRAGARAASFHTGALAGFDLATDALLSQCGVIRVDRVEELFDLAMAFGTLPIPEGNSVGIVTNAGGPGIIIADSCESAGLDVRELTPETRQRLRDVLPEEASVRNPVDMIASATPEAYRVALEAVLADPGIDAAIAAFVPPLGIRQTDVAEAIVAARRGQPGKPVLAVLMGREGLPQGRVELREAGVPGYIFPESAARALAAMYRHRRWIERPAGTVRDFDADAARAQIILARAQGEGRERLAEPEALQLLAAYGIPVVPHRTARNAQDAVDAAEAIGYPVVAKVLSPDVVHKSDVGGVRVDLRSAGEVSSAFEEIAHALESQAPGSRFDGVLVSRYMRGGRETIVGMTLDPQFGPLIMFGVGGIHVEILRDVAFRVQPVSDVDASDMVRSLKSFRLLEGVRGEPPADIGLLEEVIQRVSQLVGDLHEIAELDINPFLSFEDGGVAVDARIRLGGPRRPAEDPSPVGPVGKRVAEAAGAG